MERIFVWCIWELYWQRPSVCMFVLWQQRGDKSVYNSTTELGFCTIIMGLSHYLIALTRV